MNNEQSVKEDVFWTNDLVLEFAREVGDLRSVSDVWTTDLTAEKQALKDFLLNNKLEQLAKKHKLDLSWMAVSGTTGFEVTGDFLKDFVCLIRDLENKI